jgi:hypothetical protein
MTSVVAKTKIAFFIKKNVSDKNKLSSQELLGKIDLRSLLDYLF